MKSGSDNILKCWMTSCERINKERGYKCLNTIILVQEKDTIGINKYEICNNYWKII